MTSHALAELEATAASQGFLLRIQLRRPLNLWTARLVVGKYLDSNTIKLLGEMKGWAYHGASGLQLDTMQVSKDAPDGIGHLIWASTMAWALEETPCKSARLLAINDDEMQHMTLVRYFNRRGFITTKEVGASVLDLPLRMLWGGAGSLMVGNCYEVYQYSLQNWKSNFNLMETD